MAAANPHAWIRTPRTPDEIVTPGPDNRMVSFPYPKLCTANMQVDQGAGYIVCSVEAARAAGVPEERWVFPLAGADANDHWFISHRAELHRSPAIRLAGAAALELAGLGHRRRRRRSTSTRASPSWCRWRRPSSGCAVDDPARPLTLTGGLTFGGGPGNNYTSHGIARAVGALRAAPGSGGARDGPGLVRHQALHRDLRLAPAGARRQPSPSPGATSSPRSTPCPSAGSTPRRPGAVRVETYTVTFDRDGAAERGILACRTADGSRAWANVSDPDALALALRRGGHRPHRRPAADGTLSLDG